MNEKQQLGIFWGTHSFYFVETEKNTPTKVFSAPFYLSKDIGVSGHKETLEGMKLTENIQKAVRDNEILYTHLKLSLPTKNIIFRSFVIPWMQSSEIAGVVEFEASKYIPFKMEDLYYQYHTATITENRRKRIQILFVAIRKDVLENYCNVFQHSGLQIDAIEPAPISLLRALSLKKLLPKNQTEAVIETDKTSGRIIVVENDFPHFVREFQLALSKDEGSNQTDTLQVRLFNEVRISLDYYGRQHTHKKVDRIILLSSSDDETLANSLKEYLDISTKNLNVNTFFNDTVISQTGFVNAYGSCLRDTVLPNIDFNFLPKHVAVSDEEPVVSQPNYIATAITCAFCAGVVILSLFLSNLRLSSLEKKERMLTDQLGPKALSTAKMIDTQAEELTGKLKEYQSIRLESEVSYMMSLIPDLLPQEVWLDSLNVKYLDDQKTKSGKSAITLQLYGHVYSESEQDQVRAVNTFLQNMRGNKFLLDAFADIELTSLKRDLYNEYTVRTFSIQCK